jgi:hypothetical protein
MALDVSGWDEERLVGDLFDGCLGLIKIGAKLVLHARSISTSTPDLGLGAGTSATGCLPDVPPGGTIIASGRPSGGCPDKAPFDSGFP